MSIRDAGQVRGYSSDEVPLRTDIASATPAYNQATLVKTGYNRDSLEVLGNIYTQLVVADAVDSYAAGVITAATHLAIVGDVIMFTSGVMNRRAFTVFATATNTISLAQTPSSAPSAADTFNILRFSHPVVDSAGATSVSGTVAVSSVVPGTAATNLGKAEDAVHTTGDTGVMALGVANEAYANISGTDGDYTPIGTDRAGRVAVTGQVANDATYAGNPVGGGALALSTFQTSVGTGDLVRLVASLGGNLIVDLYEISQASSSGLTGNITTATNTSLIAAQGATNRNYLTTLTIVNDSATLNTVTISNGAGGSNLYQVRMLANSMHTITFPKPLRFNLNVSVNVNTSAASSVYVSGAGFYSPN